VPDLHARAAAGALWTGLPTSWTLGRLHAWALGAGGAAPWSALALALQPFIWLAVAARHLGRAELGARSG
jgi:hypothetical protein